jgi:ATP-dependent RNA helicase HelY
MVGLLTGDTSINPEAQIVVMTTEVLRNMIYARSSTLDDLACVVMDEVHYLADKFRGAVWEEILIHLPPEITVVSLSATVSNVEEFGEWLESVRGDIWSHQSGAPSRRTASDVTNSEGESQGEHSRSREE